MTSKPSHIETLQSHYPWTSTSPTAPLITSAPMRLISGPSLALAVSRAQGVGFLGSGTDVTSLPDFLSTCTASLQEDPIPNTPPEILPIGVGFICWGASLPLAVSAIENAQLKPSAAWLFAPEKTSDLVSWVEGIRSASSGKTKIWVQVGTIASALEVASTCKPDALVIQGSDAGGHGLVKSSSIITLLPECIDALAAAGHGHVPLIATGGIVDGRGVAAAVMLGASGICMGTRFLSSPEAEISQGYRSAVLKASDGGVTTTRTTVYDKLRGTRGWPEHYDGRGVLNHSFWDHQKGMDEEENRKLYEDAVKMGDEGWGDNGRMTTYAGAGVGLVKEIMNARDIVKEVQGDAEALLSLRRK